MNAFTPIDYGELVPGLSGLTAAGTTQLDAFILTKKVNVFASVPSGSGAVLPSSYSPGAQIWILNRDPANGLLVYPPSGDQIEANAVNAPITVAAASDYVMVCFDPPLARAPRTWWLSAFTQGNIGQFLPLSGGTLTGPGNLTVGGTLRVTGTTTLTGVATATGGFNGNTVFGIGSGAAGIGLTTNNAASLSRLTIPTNTRTWTPASVQDATTSAIYIPGQTVTGTMGAVAGAVWSFGVNNNNIDNSVVGAIPFMPFRMNTNFGGTKGPIGGMSINQTQTSDTLDPDGKTVFFSTLQVAQDLEHRAGNQSAAIVFNGVLTQGAGATGWHGLEILELGIQRNAGSTIVNSNIVGLISTNDSGNHATGTESYIHTFAGSGTTSLNTGWLLGDPGGQWPIDPTNGWLVDTYQQINNNPGLTQRMAQASAGAFNFSKVNFSDAVMKSPGVKIKGIAEIDIGPASLAANATGAQIDVTGSKGALGAVIANGAGYQVNDQIYDGLGGIINVDTINGSGGILTAHYLVGKEPFWFGGGAPATTTTTGGSGNSLATFNVTWTALTTLTLQPTGGITTIGGTTTSIGIAGGASFPTISAVSGVSNTALQITAKGTGTVTIGGNIASGNTGGLAMFSGPFQYPNFLTASGLTGPSNSTYWGNTTLSGSITDIAAGFSMVNLMQIVDQLGVVNDRNVAYFNNTVRTTAQTTGSRWNGVYTLIQTAQSGNNAIGRDFGMVGLQSYTLAGFNEGGTNLSNTKGGAWSMLTDAELRTGATNWTSLVGYELDISIATGASASKKVGMQIVQLSTDKVQGGNQDAGYVLSNQVGAVGWKNGFVVGSYFSQWPMAATGTMLTAHIGSNNTTVPAAAAWGVDFNEAIFSSGFLRGPNGFSVDGSANTQIGTMVISPGGAITTLDSTGQTGTGTPAIVSGGTGVAVGMTYFDPYGGVYTTSAQVAGVATAFAAPYRQPFINGAAPANPITLIPSGLAAQQGATNITVNLTWTAGTTLSLQPTAGGILKVGTSLMTANGIVATALTAVGPTGSHTTVQEWLTVTNATGTVRYIPCF